MSESILADVALSLLGSIHKEASLLQIRCPRLGDLVLERGRLVEIGAEIGELIELIVSTPDIVLVQQRRYMPLQELFAPLRNIFTDM